MFIIALFGVAAAALYFMTPEERTRLVHAITALVRRVTTVAVRVHAGHKASAGEDITQHPRPVVTLAVAAAILGSFVWSGLAPGDLSDPATLVEWGANFGPLTTNGEWWRLVTAGFLHAGPVAMVINLAALLHVSAALERSVGRATIVAVYLFAGVFAGLVSLSAQPVGVAVGAAGGIFGLYGLLLASWTWGVFDRSAAVRLPLIAGLAPGVLIFVVYHLTAGELPGAAQVAGVVTGFATGLLLARSAGPGTVPAIRTVATVISAAVLAIGFAVPLHGVTDVRPHVAHLLSVEKATAAAYDEQVAAFRKGHTTVGALASLIERRILPELTEAGARLNSLEKVPDAHQPLSVAAQRFFKLRVESWQLRLRGLRKSSMPMLRDADAVENRSQELLRKVLAVQSSAS